MPTFGRFSDVSIFSSDSLRPTNYWSLDPLGMLMLALELAVQVCSCEGGFVFSVPFARLVFVVMRLVAPITHKTTLRVLGDVLLEGKGWRPYTSGFLPLLAVDGLPFAAIFPLVGEVVGNKGINCCLLVGVGVLCTSGRDGTRSRPFRIGRPLITVSRILRRAPLDVLPMLRQVLDDVPCILCTLAARNLLQVESLASTEN